jgi:HAD superfamily hydrolase (TIGR01549 family)
MIKLCVFDMDGTTVDTLHTIAHYANGILEENGIATFPDEAYKDFVGAGALNMFLAVRERTGFAGELAVRMKDEWIRRYAADPLHLTRAYGGIADMLKALRDSGIKTAILTNKDQRLADAIAASLFPGGLAGPVLGDRPGRALKPDPGELLSLMRGLGVSPDECLYVGDTPIDMKTGRAAGCLTCGVSWGFRPVSSLLGSGADFIVSSPGDIVRCCAASALPDGGRPFPSTVRFPFGKQLLCFDLDGTLTQHRSGLEPENRAMLDELCRGHKVVIVGAGNCERIYAQTGGYPVDIIGNYGMQESTCSGGDFRVVRVDRSEPDRDYFVRTCAMLRSKYGFTEYAGEPLEFHSSGMVTFPLLGTAADIADKLAFDPDRAKRRRMYGEVLSLFPDYSVFIGGTSSFDFTGKRYNKYDAIMRYAGEHGYDPSRILYVGDDFSDGGGDSHVRTGGLDYVEVADYRRTPAALAFLTAGQTGPDQAGNS